MSNPNTSISDDWIHKVRVDIYEKTKNMSSEEFHDYFKKRSEYLAKKYGFTIAKSLYSKGNDLDHAK
ncbi:MAG: hypothetical protein LBF58_02840 [Deltaproteobacteria bacterium]|jgi:hypothetical protein|nr:hypothetical protein [Deltaproteobacteria bacterium]